MHGLLKGIRKNDLYINGHGYLGWRGYEDRFGFISFDPIRNSEAVSSYIMKYITKDLSRCVSKLGNQLYYCSKGLKKGEVLYKGKLNLKTEWDYETPDGYCRLKYYDERVTAFDEIAEVIW